MGEFRTTTFPPPPAPIFAGRALGLVTADVPHLNAAENRARTGRLAHEMRTGLGIVVIVATPLGPDLDVLAHRDPRTELTLLLVGPVGNDHGRVSGAVKAWGQRYDQQFVLWKPHDSAFVEALNLVGREPGVPASLPSEPLP